MHKTMRSLLLPLFIACSILIIGCGSSVPVIKPFKLDIQQGNVVTSKMLLQLRPGMTRSQVKFIMGTPLVVDSFHPNRWDYFYQMRQAGKVIEQRRVILDFENELLARVRGDVVPQGTPGAETGAVALEKELANTKKPVAKEGLLENLKFWKSKEPEVIKPVAPAELVTPESTTKQKPSESAKEILPALAPAAVTPNTAPEGTNMTTDSAVTDTEAPSMLAVPIEIAPAQAEPAAVKSPKVAPIPVTPAPVVPTPVAPAIKDTVKQAPASETQMDAVPAAPPIKTNQEKDFIFRLERELKTEDLENTQAPQNKPAQTAKPAVNVKQAPEELPPEEEPGYFERMLEKIGF